MSSNDSTDEETELRRSLAQRQYKKKEITSPETSQSSTKESSSGQGSSSYKVSSSDNDTIASQKHKIDLHQSGQTSTTGKSLNSQETSSTLRASIESNVTVNNFPSHDVVKNVKIVSNAPSHGSSSTYKVSSISDKTSNISVKTLPSFHDKASTSKIRVTQSSHADLVPFRKIHPNERLSLESEQQEEEQEEEKIEEEIIHHRKSDVPYFSPRLSFNRLERLRFLLQSSFMGFFFLLLTHFEVGIIHMV